MEGSIKVGVVWRSYHFFTSPNRFHEVLVVNHVRAKILLLLDLLCIDFLKHFFACIVGFLAVILLIKFQPAIENQVIVVNIISI